MCAQNVLCLFCFGSPVLLRFVYPLCNLSKQASQLAGQQTSKQALKPRAYAIGSTIIA